MVDWTKILLYALIVYVGVFFLLPALSDALGGLSGSLGGGSKAGGGGGEGGTTTYNINDTSSTTTTYNTYGSGETGRGYPQYSGTELVTPMGGYTGYGSNPLNRVSLGGGLTQAQKSSTQGGGFNFQTSASQSVKNAVANTGTGRTGGFTSGTGSAGGGKNALATGTKVPSSRDLTGTPNIGGIGKGKGTGGGGAGAR